MTPTEASRLDDLVAARTGDAVAFLAELVKVPSDNPPGDCAPHAARAANLLEGLGFTVEHHKVPDARAQAAGMVSAVNLIVRHRFGDGPVIALNAHGDVVPPGAGWSQDPYGAAVVDGEMYGRGAAVSKSDFATYAFALDALKRSGLALKGTVELHFTYDEEIGGEVGPGFLIEEKLTRPDYVISAGFSYAVVVAHNGCLHLEIEVVGKSAHAALPFTGIDALEAATGILTALYAYRDTLKTTVSHVPGIGSPQLTVGLISGGINTNVVPDRVTFRLDRRIVPEEAPETVEADVRAAIAAGAAAFPDARVTVRRILLARPLVPSAATQRLADALRRNAADLIGEEIPAKGVPLYTDARLYAEAGFPVVLYGAGPRTIEEANGHRADEKLRLSDLSLATRVVARTLAELLS
ncbi:M20/M25/M40 family metallo-hydrolase [Aquabacter spiritensis]|uniref:Acetylornithine deacetylase/succinyl-diaminopimelate desuccinylase family protein n=1 Tax=Aquabacter spiritensis TaxID=933073 RepID=A0A4R3M4M6_9HYPH|nr:M20/M25/M40 family metallo-hydrolase [Aquabacter spiritensis]TCT07533.1 acetylornithine deacetylase/succinyl-diaminopimelate desuccinylase family protein [Aquabacter spiritensis]